MDLTTRYLGLDLRSPLVASSGPFTGKVDSLRALQDAGIAAVVLPSLFEEQIVHNEMATAALFDMGGDNPEAHGYFPDFSTAVTMVDRYLSHLETAKRALDVPVIASLNGMSPGGWARYAKRLEDAGADALELNLYRVAADPDTSGASVEDEQLELVSAVVDAVTLPVALKVGPHYSAFGHLARRFVGAGASGLVLFNRFYQPDLDPVTRNVVPTLVLSTSDELRLPLRWVGLLAGQIDCDLAVTTGVHTGLDAAKALLAGADVVMMTSALLHHGPQHVGVVEEELLTWGQAAEYASVAQLRGSASQRHVADPEAFERANYLSVLHDYTSVRHS